MQDSVLTLSLPTFLRGAQVGQLPAGFKPSTCSIKCSIRYVLEPVVSHGPGCSSAPAAVSDATGSTTEESETSRTEEAPIADQ